MLDGMSDSIQRSRIENLHSREVDRQSPTGLIFLNLHPNLMSLTPLLKGSDIGTKVVLLVVHKSSFDQMSLLPAPMTHIGYQPELNPGLLGAGPLP